MRVRFGFVAMAMSLKNASPSQTMTLKQFLQIADRDAALRKLTRIAQSNLANSLRVLRHAHASGVHVYRFSSKLIPLFGHDVTSSWDFLGQLREEFAAIGQFVRDKSMRVSFHPEHFTLLNSPDRTVVDSSIGALERHADMFEAMELDVQSKFVIHVGGGYKNKGGALDRFVANWANVPARVKARMTLENDDKTYSAADTLKLCQTVETPMVFDLHHHMCNHEDGQGDVGSLLKPIFATWENTGLPPKVHISSPKDDKDFRAHAELINPADVLPFLEQVREFNQDIDIMVEAKYKDEALFELMRHLSSLPQVKVVDGGTIDYSP